MELKVTAVSDDYLVKEAFKRFNEWLKDYSEKKREMELGGVVYEILPFFHVNEVIREDGVRHLRLNGTIPPIVMMKRAKEMGAYSDYDIASKLLYFREEIPKEFRGITFIFPAWRRVESPGGGDPYYFIYYHRGKGKWVVDWNYNHRPYDNCRLVRKKAVDELN